MPYREGDAVVTFEGVVVVDTREPEKQERSLLCRLPDGREKFISRNQVPESTEWPENNVPFDLEVSAWLVDKWDTEPFVKLPDVVVLRDVDGKYGPALQVRLADGQKVWVGHRHIIVGSPCATDGDRGELWVSEWFAENKKLVGERAFPDGRSAPPAASRAGSRTPGRGPNVGEDARGAAPPTWGGDPGDDIPFDFAVQGNYLGRRDEEDLLQVWG